MVGITNLVDRAVDWFHIGGMQDIVDPEPEEVFIVSNSDTTARSGISIFQRSLDRTMGIRNRCIVEVTADQYIIGIDLFNFPGNCSRLAGTYLEGRPQLLFDGTSQAVERFGIQILDKCGVMAPVLHRQLERLQGIIN